MGISVVSLPKTKKVSLQTEHISLEAVESVIRSASLKAVRISGLVTMAVSSRR